jgi:hypothetical protein
MSPHRLDREPERLIDGKFGSLLREANREFTTEVDQPAAFRRVTERLARREQLSGLRWLLPATPFALAALAGVLLLGHKQRHDAAPELVAERLHEYELPKGDENLPVDAPKASAAAAPSSAEEAAPHPVNDVSEERGTKRSAVPTSVRAAASAAAEPPPLATTTQGGSEPVAEPPRAITAPAPAVGEPSEAPDCLSLARRGQTRAAETCFLERAQGSGLAAEMALYEVARLRRDVLADAAGALAALAEYRKRFPTGSLRREADMSQLEILLQLGRSDEALKQSDELLSSSASGERAAELRLLRGHILRKQSRFAAAAREYELAEGAGMRGGEATYFGAVCLEALGRNSEAAAMFTKYLEQPERPYAEDARRRLERLKP